MSKILNAVKEKFKIVKQKVLGFGLFHTSKGKSGKSKRRARAKTGFFATMNARVKASKHRTLWKTLMISVPALLLVVSITLAWYINKVELWGMEFNTGDIEFITYVYDKDGNSCSEPITSTPENETKYKNVKLNAIYNATVDQPGVAYIAVKSTGSIGIQYRIAFEIEGSIEYLGGFTYNISKVTDQVGFSPDSNLDVSACTGPAIDDIDDELAFIDRNAVSGTIEEKDAYQVYRVDFKLSETAEEYAKNNINIYFNIFATQIGGDFESSDEPAKTHFCASKDDIDRVRVEAYPGDIIKLTASFDYTGDLVFNKPVHLETNNFTLTVYGNLIYDYVLGNGLRLDVGGQGKLEVRCARDGVGGNFQIKTPISNVTLIGSNAATGDILVQRNLVIDATNAYGSSGVSFNEVKIIDTKNARKLIQLESNTRATVSFGTTIGTIQSVAGANYIEIINNGVIEEINLSNMSALSEEELISPQIYIQNNKDINNVIILPRWSKPFLKAESGKCTGNTKIIQSYTGGPMVVTGSDYFDGDDIEIETKESLVAQIDEKNNDDSRLRIYYQDIDDQTTTIQWILEDYLRNKDVKIHEVQQLEIISIGSKAVTNTDIAFMNSNSMLGLKQLDMQRANVYDQVTGEYHRLPDGAFSGVSKYNELILPQNLVAIGNNAFQSSKIENIVTIPSGVTEFGGYWFNNGYYVRFAASVPLTQATDAAYGMTGVRAVFVDEAYVASYKSVYTAHSTKIYPVSVLDQSKRHFVRNIQNDEWEITYYVGGDDTVIGENITIDSTILRITSVYDNAYRHGTFTGTVVKFANSVANLGAGNFYGNVKITNVDLNNIKYVGDEAFANASSLAKVTFGNALETIGVNAFLNCISLGQNIVLPDTMQKIGASAFQNTKIVSVNTGGTTSVDGYAFAHCSNLIYAELPMVKTVGENGKNRLFYYDGALVSVKMPTLAKVSDQSMFAYCLSLRELYMGSNDDDISLGGYPFDGCDMTKVKLYVPEEYLDFYRGKLPGGIDLMRIYPQGEKMGKELVNGFNIGTYIVSANSDGTYTLVTSNVDYTDSLVIPETFDEKEKAITRIYDYAFANQEFTNVTLELGNNIISVGNSAFYQRNGLVKVVFGDSLQEIGDSAFAACANLAQDITLPASMQSIGKEAFMASGILSINTRGTKSVEARAFANCSSLVYAKMPEVTVIAASGTNEVFSSCGSLVSVELPKVSKVYGIKMFQNCFDLAEIHMGSNDESVSLGSYPFYNIISPRIKLFVPENLVSLYQGRSIVSSTLVYPAGERLGNESVNGFVLGDYIVMNNGAGYTLVTANRDFVGDGNVPNEYNGKPITEIYANAFRNQNFTDVRLVLGNNMKTIGSAAFYGTTGLKSIVMDQVTTIGAEAFYESGIQSLNAPKLTSIGNNAFRRCSSLTMASLPKLETVDSTYVLAECTSLKSVYFENVLSLNMYTFYGDTKLEKITINRLISSSEDLPAAMTIEASAPCKIYVPYRSLSAYPAIWSGKQVVSFDISASDGVNTYILSDNNGRYVLIDFTPKQTVTDFTLPATVSASQLGNISIYSIMEGAFSTVSGTMKTLTLSSTIAQLDGAALGECSALEKIYVSADNMYFTSVNGVLYSKDARMLVKYPAGKSGKFDMTATDYAATVGIGANAFAGASKLTQIVFPSALVVIDSTAFTNCTQLNRVEFTGNTPPTLMGAGIFDTSVDGFKMVIPTASSDVVTAYLCAFNFGEYEPYIDLNGNAAPSATTPRNQVQLGTQPAMVSTYALPSPKKDDEEEKENSPENDIAGE